MSIEVLLLIIIVILLVGPTQFKKGINQLGLGFLFLYFLAFVCMMGMIFYDKIKAISNTVGGFIIGFYAVLIFIAILLVIYIVYALKKLARIDHDFYNVVYENETEIALDILQKDKPNVNVKNETNWNPLMIAAAHGNLELVKAILERKPKVNVTNQYGYTAYILAKYRGYDQIANMLVRAGAKKKKPNIELLIDCVKEKHIEGVRRCLASGLNPMTLGASKKSAFQIAINNENKTIIAYMLKYGAAPYVSRANLTIQEMYKSGRYLKYIEDYERERQLTKHG